MKNQLNKSQIETKNPMELNELTRDFLAGYINGQLKVQNNTELYTYCGDIESITINKENELIITLSWVAECRGCPSNPRSWVKSEQLNHTFPIGVFSINLIGYDSLFLESCFRNEKATIFLPNRRMLDPSQVRNLDLRTIKQTLVLTA
jgi:hypothetical protein